MRNPVVLKNIIYVKCYLLYYGFTIRFLSYGHFILFFVEVWNFKSQHSLVVCQNYVSNDKNFTSYLKITYRLLYIPTKLSLSLYKRIEGQSKLLRQIPLRRYISHLMRSEPLLASQTSFYVNLTYYSQTSDIDLVPIGQY